MDFFKAGSRIKSERDLIEARIRKMSGFSKGQVTMPEKDRIALIMAVIRAGDPCQMGIIANGQGCRGNIRTFFAALESRYPVFEAYVVNGGYVPPNESAQLADIKGLGFKFEHGDAPELNMQLYELVRHYC